MKLVATTPGDPLDVQVEIRMSKREYIRLSAILDAVNWADLPEDHSKTVVSFYTLMSDDRVIRDSDSRSAAVVFASKPLRLSFD